MKTKDIHIRASSDFFELLNGICEKLNCSKTDYIINRLLCEEYTIVNITNEYASVKKDLSSIANNLNQVGRAINKMCIDFAKSTEKDLIMSNNNFREFAEVFQNCHDQFKIIEKQFRDGESNLYQIENERMILDLVKDYLIENDPDYLEQIKKKNNKV